MRSPDSDRFFNLPALTVSKFLEMEPGDFIELGVLEYIDTGDRDHSSGAIFPFIYTHERVEFRSPGQKDAVAFGQGRMEHDQESRPCRILFSQYHQTASVRGLTLEGSVKALGMSGADIKALHKIVRGPRGLKQPDETTMNDQKESFPWDKHKVTPEAKAIASRASAQAAAESLRAKHPMGVGGYLLVAGAVAAVVGIPLILVSFFF